MAVRDLRLKPHLTLLVLTPSDFSIAPAAGSTAQLDWATSTTGQSVLDHGQSAASLLPRDDDVVLVLPPRAVSWHRLALPKVGSTRLRAVLDGLLEDRLLTDTTEMHFALEPGGRAGQTVWVAACERVWLRSWLQALEEAGRPVSRIVPAIWPLAPLGGPATPGNDLTPAPTLHWAHDEGNQVWLSSASPLGVRSTPLPDGGTSAFGDSAFSGLSTTAGSVSNELLNADPDTTRLLADPAVASRAERAFNQRFELVPRPSWLLQCAQSDWNLAQFDLSLSAGARRGQRLRQTVRRLRSAPVWKPARWGFGALVAVQLLGLNMAAWSERNSLSAKQQAVTQTLQQTFPNVTLVLDAPAQMQRELSRLQQASGQLAGGDLETMLGAVSQALPGDGLAAAAVAYTPGEARLGQWPGGEDTLRSVQDTLERNGWRVRSDGAELTLQPGSRP
ncbi:type II secretion system protein GspL [Hydrogenophaga sp.]|uniref:type II secretion system protein GspL n=1 Tax=Hydrogenophaga sp. TaxID=1904254 RepID=UPI00262FA2ED|nr:type II secretion system protein GspL [Hydrogenophaga sp.]MDM7949158.1 type II secretion system protein GspL [Hydrogenophaga sp.]